MTLLEDLRFIIGLLFGIIGVMVLVAGIFNAPAVPGVLNADLVGGAVMTAFAVLMLLLALLGRPKGP
jgi:crotonobetainyl-CoA:carnitine CoA-transferase CaiB-like acyl-CoA transferase